jgi:hypothetical protein
VTGQHLLLLFWTLWIVLALVSIGDLLGVILALVFGLLGAGLVLTGLATWRGYVIASLIVHVLVALYAVAVLRAWLRPASGRLGLRTLWNWPRNPMMQTIFGSVSFVGLVSVLLLRPTVPWKYRADIPIMILVVIAVVAVEYALLAGSDFRHPVTQEQPDLVTQEQPDPVEPEQQDLAAPEQQYLAAPEQLGPVDPEQLGPVDPEHSPSGPTSDAGPAHANGDTIEGKVVPSEQPPGPEAENRQPIDRLSFRLTNVEKILQQQVRDALAHSALESIPPVWFHASDEVGSGAQADEPITGPFSLELLRIARLTMRQKGSIGIADQVAGINGMCDRVVGITIERRTVPIPLEPDEKVGDVISRAAETQRNEIEIGAAAPGTAQPISPSGWEVVSARWVHAGMADGNTAAGTAADFGAGLDSILHNETVRPVFSWKAPGSAAAVIGKVAENKETLQVGGIVVGTRPGRSVALSACFWLLARDDLARNVAAGITRELGLIRLSRVPTPSSTPRPRARTPVRL